MSTIETPSAPAVEQTTASVPATGATSPASVTSTNGLSIVSLVLGIAGIVSGFWFAAVAAIVVGFIARNREPLSRTMSTWGIVLGFVGAFGWLVVAVIGAAIFAPLAFFIPFWV